MSSFGSDSDRYTRQRRLAEIGDGGQARIERAVAEVHGTDGADVEIRYLSGAGVRDIRHDPSAAPEPFSHEAHFRFAPARKVAFGAWRALCTVRRALEESA